MIIKGSEKNTENFKGFKKNLEKFKGSEKIRPFPEKCSKWVPGRKNDRPLRNIKW